MKTNLMMALGAVGLAAMTLNAVANSAMLSPRAAGNQIIRTATPNNDPDLVASGLTSAEYAAPRLAGAQVTKVAGTANDVNPTLACTKNMTASPKLIQACAANPGNMPCCHSSQD